MKKFLTIFFVLLMAVSLGAQQRAGNIYGRVVDTEGIPLPGVTVTLTSPFFAPMTTITTNEGTFRFLSLPPGREYSIKAELAGFATVIKSNIVVEVGANVNMTIELEPGVIEEEIVVTAITPVVDTKKTSVGTNVTQEILQGLPTARDPWVILQMAPSVMVDRENVGGAESGQQSNYVARGSNTYNNNVWAMDGIVITDPAAIGASPGYYDFDAFEEMQISVGGNDVTVQTGGIALNMVTRRGQNRVTLGGRFYLTDGKFQAKNSEKVAAIKAEENPNNLSNLFQGVNIIRNNKDYGFNLGMPLVRDKAWLWLSYGVQDIKTSTVYGTPDDTLLENYVAKLNLQIFRNNRFEVFFHSGNKQKWGRSATASNPEGLFQTGRYYFGSPILKIQDEHMIGNNIFLSLKFAYSDAGFMMIPMTDQDFQKVPIWDVTDQRYYGSQATRYYVERPVYQYNFFGQYFNDNLLGASHEFKFGVDYANRKQYVESNWNGNMMVYRNYRPTDTAWDRDGDQIPDPPYDQAAVKYFSFWRGYYSDQRVKALGVFFSDTITWNRFTFIVGLRYDHQLPYIAPYTLKAVDGPAWPQVASQNLISTLDSLLPGLEIPKRYHYAYDPNTNSYVDSKYAWSVFSPRIGFTWDITGDGKTLLKVNLAQYGDFMGTGIADRARPSGTGGWMDFWWDDSNKNNLIEFQELYWLYRRTPSQNYSPYRVFDDNGNFIGNANHGEGETPWDDASGYFWGGYDPTNPQAFGEPYTSTRKGVGSSRTREAMLSLEREVLPNFAVSLVGSYRKYDKYLWTLKYWPEANGRRYADQSYYPSRGKPEASYYNSDTDQIFIPDTKEAKNHEWYSYNAAYTVYSPYSERLPRPNYYMDYFGIDIIFNKRLANKWMVNGSFTWQWQAQHYGEGSYNDATNLWAYDGKPQAAYIGGASGKINQYTYSRWMFKISGLYQLPFGITVSGTFNMREGWVQDEYFTLYDYRIPSNEDRNADLRMDAFGSQRLPLFYVFNFRIEKMIRSGERGRIYLMADIFNVLNKMIENRRYQKYWGTVRVYGNAEGGIDWTRTTFTPNLTYDALNEVLNPRVARFGVRFEF